MIVRLRCPRCPIAHSNECNEPTPCLVQPIGAHGGEVMYFRCFCFRGEFGFMNCDDICMYVVNKQFELPPSGTPIIGKNTLCSFP